MCRWYPRWNIVTSTRIAHHGFDLDVCAVNERVTELNTLSAEIWTYLVVAWVSTKIQRLLMSLMSVLGRNKNCVVLWYLYVGICKVSVMKYIETVLSNATSQPWILDKGQTPGGRTLRTNTRTCPRRCCEDLNTGGRISKTNMQTCPRRCCEDLNAGERISKTNMWTYPRRCISCWPPNVF